MNYKLIPSAFSFLYEECPRCYYLSVVHKIGQPSIPLPSIFGQIAGLLKDHYCGKSTKMLHPALPAGIIKYGEKPVKSKQIRFVDMKNTCYISGRFDIVIEFDDKTYGVIDFKTGAPNDDQANLYSRQLHAYAYALEHPAKNALRVFPIKVLGLLYFYPSKISQTQISWLSYNADIHWVAIKKDEKTFLTFIREVMQLLDSPHPPSPSVDCKWCQYVDKLKNVR